jgi:hypothetical protein
MEGETGVAPSGVKTGLFSALEEIRSEMLDAGALTVAKMVGTLKEARSTAITWPPVARSGSRPG